MARLPESDPHAHARNRALYLGLDIGSTTVKVVVLDAAGELLFSRYRRHFSEVRAAAAGMLREAGDAFGQNTFAVAVSGSGAITAAEDVKFPFVQEVIASSLAARTRVPDVDVVVELGGEDAKLSFFTGGVDQRMNETCAGGTGAFIDQMASFINTDAAGLDALALQHTTIYPIASRCGVFAKTDILPLLNEGCRREDIAASIMQAVVDQTISGLARGRRIRGKVLFLGGPPAFLLSLRERFTASLNLEPGAAIFPEHAEYFVAMGAALYARERVERDEIHPTEQAPHHLAARLEAAEKHVGEHLPAFFASAEERADFHARHTAEGPESFPLEDYEGDAFLGFDSGSTTIKAALIDAQGRLLYSFYGPNKGDPLPTAAAILKDIYARKRPGCVIRSSCAAGYGSALVGAALRLDHDEVETMAHFAGARFFQPKVGFILDIGGQDIKCLRIRNGVIDRIQLNEACSAGCGSFIETFARSLNLSLDEFTEAALTAQNPVDLGTRCTVFMNSMVRQAQKDGAKVGDIAAGLCSSVVRNACYKVMKLSGPEELGEFVSVQGGAFAGDGLLRAFEQHLDRNVVRPALPGLMGAFGAALIAKERGPAPGSAGIIDAETLNNFSAHSNTSRCALCTNRCMLTVTRFGDGRRFISGNRCERGAGETPHSLPNLYRWKYDRLFNHYAPLEVQAARRGRVGLPRTLNIYENYPLWFTLFTTLGFRVELSEPSSKDIFYKGYGTIPSQTVCYPAKLAHGHILDLVEKRPDAIFFPCLPFEIKEFSTQTDHYNCPVVIGYPELLAKNVGELQRSGIPFYHDFLPLSPTVLGRSLLNIPLFADVPAEELETAVAKAFAEQAAYKAEVARQGEKVLHELHESGAFGIVLAGHPYHVDPEVHHGIADCITSCGMGVLTEDSVSHLAPDSVALRVVDQWTYHSRLYHAGAYAAGVDNLAVLQLVSFGCGLDAITSDQLEEILTVKGRLYAQIKIDEGENLGPARIRIRSLLAAMRERRSREDRHEAPPAIPVYKGSPPYTEAMRETHTILIPQLSPMHFQFLETIFEAEGYRCAQLPEVVKDAVETGLRHVHNDACFPAVVVVGQLLHAVRSGAYDTNRIALMISQTGGGCRATNYIAFLRKALVDAGLEHIPIISFNMGGMDKNPGFRLTRKMLRRIIMAGFYGDALMRISHRLTPYEINKGDVDALIRVWVERIKENLRTAGFFRFHRNMARLVQDFDDLPIRTEERKPRVGLVGEILLKYHPDANNGAAKVVEEEGGEAVVPDLMDFVLYSFHDSIYRYRHLGGTWRGYASGLMSIALLEYCRRHMRRALLRSKRFTAPLRFHDLRRCAEGLISLGHQTGEGWLLAAEMVELLESGVPNILCMQPFGCLPNHITGKGLLKELKRRYPEANIAAVDYDPGASEVNQINRIKLMMSVAR